MNGHAETQPRVEPGRVALHRRVDQPLDVGEVNDAVKVLVDLALGQPEETATQVDVLAPGELRMEAGAQLDQRHGVAGDSHAPLGRPGHA